MVTIFLESNFKIDIIPFLSFMVEIAHVATAPKLLFVECEHFDETCDINFRLPKSQLYFKKVFKAFCVTK